MKEVVKRTKIVISLISLVSILFIFVCIYFPMRQAMQKNCLIQFDYSAQNTIKIFKDSIEKAIQGTKSLSSRSVIRDKITEFLDNKISFNDLASFSKNKYSDGTNVLTNLHFAERIINGQTLIQINNTEVNYKIDVSDITVQETTYKIYEDNSQYQLKVISPIISNKKILGYDVLFFSLTDKETKLQTNTTDTLCVCVNKTKTEDSQYLYYYETLSNGTVLSVKAPKKIVFSKVSELTFVVIIRIAIFIICISLLIYFFIIRFMYKKMNNLSQDRDIYKGKATIDTLTGAYTRMYLSMFIKQQQNTTFTIALLDLDNFKDANDTYGHLYGDEILKTLVKCSKNALRTNDAIVRIGGDEFILIFNATQVNQAEKIIERIKKYILETKYAQVLQFSYGLSFVDDVNRLYNYIKEVDAKMYEQKKIRR